MGKALEEIGGGAAARYGLGQLLAGTLRLGLLPPQARAGLLRFVGARIGRQSVIHPLTLINLYRGGPSGLSMGRECFIGEECLLDLACGIVLGDQVTLSARVTVLTHLNVGFRDHPLQERFPSLAASVAIGDGSFVGAGATLLPGVKIGARAFVAASALVREDVPDGALVAGVPARRVDPA